MKTQWLAVAVLVALATVALGQDKPKGTQLKNAELSKLLETPVKIDGYSSEFRNWFSLILARGGLAFQQYVDKEGNAAQQHGKWRVQGDMLCVNVNVLLGDVCRNQFLLEDGSYEARKVDSGQLQWTYRIQKSQ